MARRSRNRGWIMDVLMGTAVAGFGLSFGRDTYKFTKDNLLFMVAAFVLMGGTAYGVWNISRGHDRGPVATFFLTYALNGLIILVSAGALVLIIAGIMSKEHLPASPGQVMSVVVPVQLILAGVGLTIGLTQRRGRMQGIEAARYNQRFLRDNGFREVGGNDDTIIAPDGNELKLEDMRLDAVIFKVAGRRTVRAKILLDDKGRMTQYVAP
jgi:hypothetical protein